MPGGFDPGEDAQSLFQSRAAKATQAGAIGFIEGGFEDEGPDNFADRVGHEMHVLLAFDDAGSGNQRNWPAPAERNNLAAWCGKLNGL